MPKEISIEEWKEWTQSFYFRELINMLYTLKSERLEYIVTAQDRDAVANQVIGIDDAIGCILALKGEQDD